MEDKRIRLVFKDDDILNETQKADGLNRSWVLLKPQQHDTVSDVASHLLRAFQLHQNCPNGLLLSISGYVLPPFESTQILKDNEIIRVQKRRDVLAIAGNYAATNHNPVEKLKLKGLCKQQPESSGVLLLANEEFENEKGGYESDIPEEEDEEILKDAEKLRSRKRKAPEKLRGSKKKKQRAGASGSVANDVRTEKNVNSVLDGGLTEKKSLLSEEKNDDSDAEDNVENNEETAKLSSKSCVLVPDLKRNDETQEHENETKGREDGEIVPEKTAKTEKRASRSARRKKIKRQWLKEMAKIQKQNMTCESEGLRNWKEDQTKTKGKTVDGEFEGLRNWKEDQTKTKRKTVDGEFEGLPKWKKHQANAEKNEVDDEPKGLLHWKQSRENGSFLGKKHHQRNKKNDFVKHSNQNGDVQQQKKKKTG